MNYSKESPERLTLTRTGFEALVQRIISAIALPTTTGDKALATLKQDFGIEGDLAFRPYWSSEEGHMRWEHPELTRHNKACGSRGILSQGFFTLYAKIVDYVHPEDTQGPSYSKGYVEFTVGRIGNTYSVGRTYDVVDDPPQEDPQSSLFQEVIDD